MSSVDIKGLCERWAAGDRDLTKLSTAELEAWFRSEQSGGTYPGELGIQDDILRHRALDSPSFLATEVVDPYYRRHFEPIHYRCMDEAIGPYLLGEDVTFEGQTYDPKDYLGFMILFSRFTYKSSMAWLSLLWCYLVWKIRQNRDARAMYVHQVISKAVSRGENIRNVARGNDKFRAAFPEFAASGGEWDTKQAWNWPCFRASGAGEPSFTAYGETSEKTGGHHSPRIVDDWETEHLKTPESREDNYQTFLGMDPLIDDSEGFCPLLVCGTTYFFNGTHERLVRDGGYLVWKVPAHRGSPKVLFDLAGLDPRVPKQKQKIDRGIKRLETERGDDLNFPLQLSWKKLYMRARGQGRLIYPGQMLQNPTPEGENRFDLDALDSVWVDKIPPPEEMWIYIRCDPAISKKRRACETAYIVGGVTWYGWRFIIDGWMGRESQPNLIVRRGFDLARKWQNMGYAVKSIAYEAVQYQQALEKIARYGVPEREAKVHGEDIPVLMRPCPIIGLPRHPDVSQDERIMSMDGPISRLEVKILKSCPIAQRLHDQLRQFPNGPRDGIDAMQGLWEKTSVPAKPLTAEGPSLPLHVLALMDRVKRQPLDRPQLCGTNRSVALTSWN